MQPVRDESRLFAFGLAFLWAAAVLPLLLSLFSGNALSGIPLVSVVLWFLLLRLARWRSPAARADVLLTRGKATEALSLATRALAIKGFGGWNGVRRLVWLNRRTSALLALGRCDEALASALEAMAHGADPETIGNCALALLRLNRYEEAASAARLVLSLTRERSVVGNSVLAAVMLGRRQPAEAEALALAGLEDVRTLLPFVRTDHYVLCLAVLSRALRLQGKTDLDASRRAARHRADLRKAAARTPNLRAMALLEEADAVSALPEQRPRALGLISAALAADLSYTYWYVAQPGTFKTLRQEEVVASIVEAAGQQFAQWQTSAPSNESVAAGLQQARLHARPKPPMRSSQLALTTQIATLAGTAALLMIWVWRFFLFGF
ncbi:MAG: hypothetical protein OJF49_004204 [Ktedonobacterales bacterium]|jgi:tetratricopeptide (TPR) repeat protein|nr:MAG: hypothetical protein OJF49_004204 [Ktedonobacterales bacterium]